MTAISATDIEMFHRLGIDGRMIQLAGIARVTDREARDQYGIKGPGDMTGVVYPYRNPENGHRWTARVRRDNPDIEDGKPKRKYVSAYGDRKHLYFPPGVAELIADITVPVVLVEAEKSVLAGVAFTERTKQKLLFVGLGGCYGWRGRIGKVDGPDGEGVDEYGPLADLGVCSKERRVFVLFDANAATNQNVQAARRELTKQLRKQGADVRVLELPGGEGVNGPDDFLALRGDAEFQKVLDGAVEGAALLDDIDSFLRTHFHFANAAQAAIVALWVAHTYVYDLFPWTPYLGVTSPTKRCGKSRLLEILEYLVRSPLSFSNATAAAIFRSIEKFRPTVLFDEADATFKGDPEMQQAIRGVLNSGAKHDGRVPRVVGQGKDMDVKLFNVFCPKALAGIGHLPDTISDRSIIIRVHRKPKSAALPKMRVKRIRKITDPLRQRLESWTSQIRSTLDGVEPEMPEGLDDRKEDGAEVLLAIADEAGGRWTQAARKALVQVCGGANRAEDDDYRVQLLSDIRSIIQTAEAELVTSKELTSRLCSLEERPWPTWGRSGKGLTPNKLAAMLHEFGICPKQNWVHGENIRGYLVRDFEAAFTSYLGAEVPEALEPASTLNETRFSQDDREPVPNTHEKCEIGSKHAVPSSPSASTRESEEVNETPAPSEEFDTLTMRLVKARLGQGLPVRADLVATYERWIEVEL